MLQETGGKTLKLEKYMITIDGGTTNTRIALWNSDHICVDIYKSEAGVRETAISGSNKKLLDTVKEGICILLEKRNLKIEAVSAVYASGMITSAEGIKEVPHIKAPSGLKEFAEAVQVVSMPEVCVLPIHFIPGMKNGEATGMDEIEKMDMMRGEETEALALLKLMEVKEPVLLVLPGSHNKFVTVDKKGKLTGCLTTLSGELLSAVTRDTIIADSVGHSFAPALYDRKMLLKGFQTARETSLTRAIFLTRILKQFEKKKEEECAAYLLGAMIASDIAAVKGSRALKLDPQMRVIVMGKEPLRSALIDLFKEDKTFSNITGFENQSGFLLSGYGALQIAAYRGDF